MRKSSGIYGIGLFILIMIHALRLSASAASGPNSADAYKTLSATTTANASSFYVYLDQDSGFNHGFPSGFFASPPANLSTIHVDTGCVDDLQASNGCSTSSAILDQKLGTVFRVSFDPQSLGNFAGVNIEEPQNYGSLLGAKQPTGIAYDLTGATEVVFDVRSPDAAGFQFGVGGCTAPFMKLGHNWRQITLPLRSLKQPFGGTSTCPPDIEQIHILFSVGTDGVHAPNGATVLLNDIQFLPVPKNRASAIGFPLANQTFGVVPLEIAAAGLFPFPPDQVLRNLTTTYESSIALLALIARGDKQDLADATSIANGMDYALHNENAGDPIPAAPDTSTGLHNGYENGDLPLFNNQSPPEMGQAGNSRLAGFTATQQCPTTGFCLVLDGATGGNNAFAILALLAAFEQSHADSYLNDAREIGNWFVQNLTDTTGTGYGGYYFGYPDMGVPRPKPLMVNKSIENNADIFAAFTALAAVETQLGNTAAAGSWTIDANVAGDFVMQMYDSINGRFNVGTVPTGTMPGLGVCPTGSQQGNEVIDTCDFLDAQTFVTLAMAGAPRYRNQIDWRMPIQYALSNFKQTVTAAGRTYTGFDIVPSPIATTPNGIAWEFTGQMVVAMNYVDQLYAQKGFATSAKAYLAQIGDAQKFAPFKDGDGLVAATLQNGDQLAPLDQCLDTPFQCIAERVGLAATVWSIFADENINPFLAAAPK